MLIREGHIKVTIRSSPVRVTITQNTKNNKCCWECGEDKTPVHNGQGCKLAQPPRRTVWNILKKLKIELSYDLKMPHLDIYIWRKQNHYFKEIYAPSNSLPHYLRESRHGSNLSIQRGTVDKKMWYIHKTILLNHKKIKKQREILPFETLLDRT